MKLVYPQDITLPMDYDALVVPTNSFLCGSKNKGYWLFRARKNVETRVHEKAGSALQKELDTSVPFLNEESKIKGKVGDVIRTSAYGDLKHMKSLYHVVVPRTYSTQTPKHIDELRECYQKVLEIAILESGVEKVGMPSLGSGIGGIEPNISADQFIAACEQLDGKLSVECSFIERKPFIMWQKALEKYKRSTSGS